MRLGPFVCALLDTAGLFIIADASDVGAGPGNRGSTPRHVLVSVVCSFVSSRVCLSVGVRALAPAQIGCRKRLSSRKGIEPTSGPGVPHGYPRGINRGRCATGCSRGRGPAPGRPVPGLRGRSYVFFTSTGGMSSLRCLSAWGWVPKTRHALPCCAGLAIGDWC